MAASPDDVAVDTAGNIWVSSRTGGIVAEYSADGHRIAAFADTSGPEGVAIVPGGDIVVADQNTNSLSLLDPATGRFRTLATYPNRTANAGIDGITWDATQQRLLVPDSPTGEVFAVSMQGATTATLATRLGRPVDAISDGTATYVAAENRPGLVQVTGNSQKAIGSFTDLDEVVALHGLLYVLNAGSGEVDAVDPASGREAILMTHVAGGQGLATGPGGDLILADSTADTVVRFSACG